VSTPVTTVTFQKPHEQPWFTTGPAIVAYIAAVKLLLLFLAAGRYGYFRDELYYLACADHLDWGYVDQPPMIALVTWLATHVLGDSLFALRLLPALAGAGKILIAGAIARELGGDRFAQGLTAFTVLAAPIYLGLDNLLTMNAFEGLFWMGCAYVLILIIQRRDAKLWIRFGVLAGLGLENKYSIAVFGIGIVVGLLLTPERKYFASKWLWIGAAVTLLIFLPNLLWNVQHHWPFFELMHNIRASGRDIQLSPVEFILQQILIVNPAAFPIWAAGLLFLFFSPKGRRFMALGWTYLVALLIFILLKGKIYYLAPAYPMLFAAGSVAVENTTRGRWSLWTRSAIVLAVAGVGAALGPVMLPVLPIDTYLRYQSHLPFPLPTTEKSHLGAALPQWYADQFGWQEMTATVARVYHSLPERERADTVIFAGNYGEAAAIDFFGPRYGLPKAVSGHQNYFFWGPRNYTRGTAIVLGVPAERLRGAFDQIEHAAELNHLTPFRLRTNPSCCAGEPGGTCSKPGRG
jgi:hypothetical protein